ncbi:MAG: hypothetical protein ABGY41_10920 [Candidatus Poribacteria bacterium]
MPIRHAHPIYGDTVLKYDPSDIDKRFQELAQQGRLAPAPERDDVPDWLQDGVQDIYETDCAIAACSGV